MLKFSSHSYRLENVTKRGLWTITCFDTMNCHCHIKLLGAVFAFLLVRGTPRHTTSGQDSGTNQQLSEVRKNRASEFLSNNYFEAGIKPNINPLVNTNFNKLTQNRRNNGRPKEESKEREEEGP